MDIESVILKGLTKNLPKAEIKLAVQEQARYFHVSPHDKTKYICARLQYMKQAYLELLGIAEFQPINYESTKPFCTYGLVTSVLGNKLDEECYIQNTEDGSNILMRLNLSSLDCYSLFSGQIVAMKCRNIKGTELLVESIYSLPIVNTNSAKRGSLDFLVARGCFSEEGLERLFSQNPEVLVLFGPFTAFGTDALDSYGAFIDCLENKLRRNMHTRIILVPSLDDPGFLHVFPQPAVHPSSERVIQLSNPACFYINNHFIVAVNMDTLMDLSAGEMAKAGQHENDILFRGSRAARLAHHMIFQRSFVPVFPSRFNVAYGDWLNMDIAPDVLLTSSKMERFHCDVGPFMFVNIGSSSAIYHSVTSTGTEYAVSAHNSEI